MDRGCILVGGIGFEVIGFVHTAWRWGRKTYRLGYARASNERHDVDELCKCDLNSQLCSRFQRRQKTDDEHRCCAAL